MLVLSTSVAFKLYSRGDGRRIAMKSALVLHLDGSNSLSRCRKSESCCNTVSSYHRVVSEVSVETANVDLDFSL